VETFLKGGGGKIGQEVAGDYLDNPLEHVRVLPHVPGQDDRKARKKVSFKGWDASYLEKKKHEERRLKGAPEKKL